MSFGGASSTIHDLKIIFTGIDRVSHVADSIQSKVKALGGAIAALGGTGLLVTNLARQFRILGEEQADALNKTFSLVTATGSLITVFARLIPVLQGLSAAQSIANAARAVALALSGPVGWGILAGAAVALAAFGIYLSIQGQEAVGGRPTMFGGAGPAAGVRRGQFGLDTMVSGPTLFLAGESGRERVTIAPETQAGNLPGLTANINIYGASDPEATARAVKRELENLVERERIRRS